MRQVDMTCALMMVWSVTVVHSQSMPLRLGGACCADSSVWCRQRMPARVLDMLYDMLFACLLPLIILGLAALQRLAGITLLVSGL